MVVEEKEKIDSTEAALLVGSLPPGTSRGRRERGPRLGHVNMEKPGTELQSSG